MPRNMSFSLTTAQFRARTKHITRRDGWLNLKEGDVVIGVEKCMGLKKGERVVSLCPIRVTDVRREPLSLLIADPDYGRSEAVLEGFPHLTGEQFAEFYIACNGGDIDTPRTRIAFEYLDAPESAR